MTKTTLSIIAAVIGLCAASCSGKSSKSSADDGAPAVDSTIVTTAHNDAARVLQMKADDPKIERELLYIRAKEYHLRANGHEANADLYIATVEADLGESGEHAAALGL